MLGRLAHAISLPAMAISWNGRFRIFTLLMLRALPRKVRDAADFVSLSRRMLRDVTVKVDGLAYRPLDFESLAIISNHFEPWLKPLLKFEEGSVVIDVGAHIGKYTVLAANHVGHSGHVVAIEPNPENFKQLLLNIKLNHVENVSVFNVAAWNENTELTLFVGDRAGHHTIKRNFGLGGTKVEARTIQSIAKELGLSRVDLIKIDVEGSECEVLSGLTEILGCTRTIVSEVLSDNMPVVQAFAKQRNLSFVKIHSEQNVNYVALLS